MMDGLGMVLLLLLLLASAGVQMWLLLRLWSILKTTPRSGSATFAVSESPSSTAVPGVTYITDVREAKLADRLDRDGK